MGKDADAAYYLGLFYRLNAEYRNAVFQFQRALDMGIDPMKKEQIEKLLKECRKRGRFLTQESEQRQRNVTQVTPGTRMLRVR
jgi:hypothetical protein